MVYLSLYAILVTLKFLLSLFIEEYGLNGKYDEPQMKAPEPNVVQGEVDSQRSSL